jgi:hypothetical protein
MDARGGRRRCAAGPRAAVARRGAARPLPAHPVLPEAVSLLLLPGLHRQELAAGAAIPGDAGVRVGAARAGAGDCGPPARFRVLRRRDAVLPVHAAARGPGQAPHRRDALGRRGGDYLRVRARDAHRGQARGDSPARGDAPEPGGREFRRPHPRSQRPRAPVRRDRPGLRVRAEPRVSADQHRPDRRHARRDR